MRRLAAVLPLLFAAILILTVPHTAEAKRMGGGSTLGKQYSVPKRDTTTSTTTAPRQDSVSNPGSATRPSGASRWLGPLAGLAAGGLIAAMLFGDGFQGFQFFDFLVIAALVFGVIMLFRAMRPRPALQPAGGPSLGGALPEQPAAAGYTAPAAGDSYQQAPAWFNAESFIKNARVHFIRLQSAWDKGDMKDIATYTTPELYAELQAQRLASGNESNYTEVSYLDAELLGVQRDGDNVVATIKFFGGIKEQQHGETQEFTELWHVIHAWDTSAGDWYVAGIQQVDAQ